VPKDEKSGLGHETALEDQARKRDGEKRTSDSDFGTKIIKDEIPAHANYSADQVHGVKTDRPD
jgi:hypothetical protein